MNKKNKNSRKKIFNKYLLAAISIGTAALIPTPKITAEDIQKNLNPPKTYTSPFEWTGHISPEYNAWVTGDTLTSSVIRIYGPAKIKNARSYQWLPQRNGKEPKFQHFNKAHFKVASPKELEEIIGRFEKDNRFLKSEALKNSLTRGVYLPLRVTDDKALKVFDQAIKDGELIKEELDKITNGVYGFWYVSEDGKAYPLPGIIYINYDKSKQKVEGIEVGKEVEGIEVGKEDKLKRTKGLVSRIEAGVDYHTGDQLVIPQISYKFGLPVGSDKLMLGPTFGLSYGEFKLGDEIITTPEDPVTGFYGHGITKEDSKKTVFDALFGVNYAFTDWFNVGLNAGISYLNETINENIAEQIRNRNGDIVAENTDSYTNTISRLRPKITGEIGFNSVGDVKFGGSLIGGVVIDCVEPEKSSAVIGGRGHIKF